MSLFFTITQYIETTVGKFIESLNLPSYSVMRGAVQYKNSLQGMELYEALFTKEEYYKDEREFRFYFEKSAGRMALAAKIEQTMRQLGCIQNAMMALQQMESAA